MRSPRLVYLSTSGVITKSTEVLTIYSQMKPSAVRWRISSKFIFASCVGYFDRAEYGFYVPYQECHTIYVWTIQKLKNCFVPINILEAEYLLLLDYTKLLYYTRLLFRRKKKNVSSLSWAKNTACGVRLLLRFNMYLFLAQCEHVYLFLAVACTPPSWSFLQGFSTFCDHGVDSGDELMWQGDNNKPAGRAGQVRYYRCWSHLLWSLLGNISGNRHARGYHLPRDILVPAVQKRCRTEEAAHPAETQQQQQPVDWGLRFALFIVCGEACVRSITAC